jgi:hypothetical protein
MNSLTDAVTERARWRVSRHLTCRRSINATSATSSIPTTDELITR